MTTQIRRERTDNWIEPESLRLTLPGHHVPQPPSRAIRLWLWFRCWTTAEVIQSVRQAPMTEWKRLHQLSLINRRYWGRRESQVCVPCVGLAVKCVSLAEEIIIKQSMLGTRTFQFCFFSLFPGECESKLPSKLGGGQRVLVDVQARVGGAISG